MAFIMAFEVNAQTLIYEKDWTGVEEYPYDWIYEPSLEGTGATLEMSADGVIITNPCKQDVGCPI